jgi:hypothetical protein
MTDEVATDIKDTKAELKEVTAVIKTIRTGDDAAVEALGYGSRDEAKADLAVLTAKEAQLNDQLKTLYDTRKIALTQQQQHSGAGTSMLRVRQGVPSSNVLLHTPANLLAFRVCVRFMRFRLAQLWRAAVGHIYWVVRLRNSMHCKG